MVSLIVALAGVVAWAQYLARDIIVRKARLQMEERITLANMMRDERDTGVVATLVKRMAEVDETAKTMHREQVAFLANARAR